MMGHRMLTINHEPVPAWNWPGMVMNFTFAEGVDMGELSVGQAIEFEMQKGASGQYEIVDYKLSEASTPAEVWIDGDISMLMADFGMITLTHQPVSEWNWPEGEMNFSVDGGVELGRFAEGQSVRFLVAKNGSDYVLKALEQKGGNQ